MIDGEKDFQLTVIISLTKSGVVDAQGGMQDLNSPAHLDAWGPDMVSPPSDYLYLHTSRDRELTIYPVNPIYL